MTRIKICGLRRMEDVETVNRMRPESIGFVFDPTRRRYITPETAAELRGALDRRINAVGVFVDAPIDTIKAIADAGTIQMIQLHGAEDEDYIAELRKCVHLPIIKAFRVTCKADVERAVRSSADLILLDNGTGGTGAAFDWEILRTGVARHFVLAGGLNPDNVSEALRGCRPYAVDVSSGVETDGCKDPEKIRRFIETVRSHDE